MTSSYLKTFLNIYVNIVITIIQKNIYVTNINGQSTQLRLEFSIDAERDISAQKWKTGGDIRHSWQEEDPPNIDALAAIGGRDDEEDCSIRGI